MWYCYCLHLNKVSHLYSTWQYGRISWYRSAFNLSIGISWYVDSILKYFICKNDFCTICIKNFVDINYLLFIKIFQMSLDERLEIIFAVTELLFFFFIKNKSKRKYKWKIQFSLDFRFNRLSQSMIQLCKFLKIDLHSHPPLQVLG